MSHAHRTFRTAEDVLYADTCEPLREAVARGEARLIARARGGYPGEPFPDRSLDNLLTVGFWDAPKPQSWGLDWHYNEGIEFTFLDRGATGFAVDDLEYPFHAGQLTITRPWQRHRVGLPRVGACRLHWLILDVGVRHPHQPWRFPGWVPLEARALKRLVELLQHNEQPVWAASPEIEASFSRLSKLASSNVAYTWESRLRLEVGMLLVAVLELLDSQAISLDESLSSSRRSVELLFRDLNARLSEPWTLDRLAAECGLGRTQFVRYCREVTGMTPAQYLQFARIERAKELLVGRGASSITAVAELCGFESSQYFATVFHERAGLTPREFRARAMREAPPLGA